MSWIQPRGVIVNGRRRGRTDDDELSFEERLERRVEGRRVEGHQTTTLKKEQS